MRLIIAVLGWLWGRFYIFYLLVCVSISTVCVFVEQFLYPLCVCLWNSFYIHCVCVCGTVSISTVCVFVEQFLYPLFVCLWNSFYIHCLCVYGTPPLLWLRTWYHYWYYPQFPTLHWSSPPLAESDLHIRCYTTLESFNNRVRWYITLIKKNK